MLKIFSVMGGYKGVQYVENTPEMSKNQGLANSNILFRCSNLVFFSSPELCSG